MLERRPGALVEARAGEHLHGQRERELEPVRSRAVPSPEHRGQPERHHQRGRNRGVNERERERAILTGARGHDGFRGRRKVIVDRSERLVARVRDGVAQRIDRGGRGRVQDDGRVLGREADVRKGDAGHAAQGARDRGDAGGAGHPADGQDERGPRRSFGARP
jgi:hypothetical protein